jgi:predicted tellurium resistance membrane protein TerC
MVLVAAVEDLLAIDSIVSIDAIVSHAPAAARTRFPGSIGAECTG